MRRMRRALLATLVVVGALGIWTASAQAFCLINGPCGGSPYYSYTFATSQPKFVGWAHAKNPQSHFNLAGNEVHAWRWANNRWNAVNLTDDTWIYVEPYATSWDWAFTWQTGWLVLDTSHIAVKETYHQGCSTTGGHVCPM